MKPALIAAIALAGSAGAAEQMTTDTKAQPRIVCAAAQHPYRPELVAIGIRHNDELMFRSWVGLGRYSIIEFSPKQGFIDQFGKFHTREEAYVIAKAAGQIIHRCGGDDGVLYSENLY